MKAYLLSLSTHTPPYFEAHDAFAEKLIEALRLDKRQSKLVQKIFRGTKIKKRHTVIEDFLNPRFEGPLFGSSLPESAPGMSQRNEVYIKEAPLLAHATAEKTLNSWKGSRQDITHLISVSCTGLTAPGIEFLLLESLGLSRSTDRLGINFMGCFGAFKGLSIAKSIARENPNNRVLLVCTELCSLHLNFDGKLDTIISNAIFSDGAASLIVGCEPRPEENPLMEIVSHSSYALSDTLPLMTWEARDEGLVMGLSREVPKIIEKHAASFAKSLLGENIDFSDCCWPIHPGGKAILESVEKSCQLDRSQTSSSWEIWENYGNMTFLFVLENILNKPASREWNVGLGFGPGLSMEGMLLRRIMS
ncbi:MAG: putative naringenin-chalcone synthase [Chlamydiales bacterium]|jgi:predicted naringenin-chalcone synthase